MIIYYIVLVILIIIWFFFAFNCKVRLYLRNDELYVTAYKIPILKKKNDKFYQFIYDLIPKDKVSIKKEIDYTKLIKLVHIDKLYCNIGLNAPIFIIAIINILNNNREIINALLEKYVKEYNIKIIGKNNNEFCFEGIINFNVGIILINVFLIKRRYRYGKVN